MRATVELRRERFHVRTKLKGVVRYGTRKALVAGWSLDESIWKPREKW
jgi:hypothetical protein